MAKALLRTRVFESTSEAAVRFPKVFRPFPTEESPNQYTPKRNNTATTQYLANGSQHETLKLEIIRESKINKPGIEIQRYKS